MILWVNWGCTGVNNSLIITERLLDIQAWILHYHHHETRLLLQVSTYLIKLDTVLLSNRICFLIHANLLCMLIFGTCWIIQFSRSPETTPLSYKWNLKLLVSRDYNKYELNQRGLWISLTLHTTRSRQKWDEWSLLSGKTIILPFLTLFAAFSFATLFIF